MVAPMPGVIAMPRSGPICLAVLRVAAGLLWVQNLRWKNPADDFGRGVTPPRGLYQYTGYAVEHPVLAPYAWFVEHVVQPNFLIFAWLTVLVEAGLAAFLLVGLATRLWAVIGMAQTLAITFSVLNAPNEWHWSYFLMFLTHLVLWATAAGRFYGVDALLRPSWQRSSWTVSRLLARVS